MTTMGDRKHLEPWVADSFSIEAGSGGTYDELFANGLMQAHITITVEAHQHNPDTNSNEEYTLWPHDWMTLELQLAGGRPLPDAWKTSYTENEFAHDMPSRRRGKPEQTDIPTPRHTEGDKPRKGKLNFLDVWLTTTKAETQELRARILVGSGEWIATDEGGNSTTVTIKSHPAEDYTPDKLKVEHNTAGGTWWQVSRRNESYHIEHPWHATNYYVYPGVYQLQKADVTWTWENLSWPRIFVVDEDKSAAVVGAGFKIEDGVHGQVNYQHFYGEWRYDFFSSLNVNEREGVPCLTHVRFEFEDSPPDYPENFHVGDMWFQFWDIYGNHGKFYPQLSGDKSSIEFHVMPES